MLVSVIIPNYNYAPYLRQRIESVLNQTYPHFEVIILDDCSTDNSMDIINDYKDDKHISKIIVNEQNSGTPFVQWKKGISLANGDLIWIAESDDYADEKFLEKVVAIFKNNSKIALCQVGATMIDENNKPIALNYDRWDKETEKPLIFDSNIYINKYLKWSSNLYNASGIVFRKQAATPDMLNEITQFKVCGDWMFWLNIVANSKKIAIIKQKLNFFRKHTKSVSYNIPVIEDIYIFSHLIQQGFFKKNTLDFWIMTGINQREIKHIVDENEKKKCNDYLMQVVGISNKFPYHFSQFCKFLNRIVPFCTFPPVRKM